jgi:hypothetical protein
LHRKERAGALEALKTGFYSLLHRYLPVNEAMIGR